MSVSITFLVFSLTNYMPGWVNLYMQKVHFTLFANYFMPPKYNKKISKLAVTFFKVAMSRDFLLFFVNHPHHVGPLFGAGSRFGNCYDFAVIFGENRP
jgi:hypothetical protein